MATEAEARSLFQLEREAEHTRADLIHTVDELHSRVSPQAIKEEVKAYARETRQNFVQEIQRRARENPLQTVVIAAGLAYPAWRFLVNMPAPVLLVGAGLALSQAGGPTRRYERSRMGEAEPLTDGVKRTVREASSSVSDAFDNLKEAAAAAVGDAKSAVTSRVTELGDRAGATIGDAAAYARNASSDTVAAVRETLSGTYQSGKETVQSGIETVARTGEQLTESFRQSTNALAESIQSHPLVVGGIGLAIGAVIASALPVTETENRLFGETSDEVKSRARDLAAERLEGVKAAAQDVYESSRSRAEEQGLSPEVARETVKDVGKKIRDVVSQTSDALDDKGRRTPVPAGSNILTRSNM